MEDLLHFVELIANSEVTTENRDDLNAAHVEFILEYLPFSFADEKQNLQELLYKHLEGSFDKAIKLYPMFVYFC